MPNTEAAAQELSDALTWGEEAMAPLRLAVERWLYFIRTSFMLLVNSGVTIRAM